MSLIYAIIIFTVFWIIYEYYIILIFVSNGYYFKKDFIKDLLIPFYRIFKTLKEKFDRLV